jgi:hypothetical protein
MKGNCGVALITKTVYKCRILLLSISELWLGPGIFKVLVFMLCASHLLGVSRPFFSCSMKEVRVVCICVDCGTHPPVQYDDGVRS